MGSQPQVPAALTQENHPNTDCTEFRCTVRTCNSSYSAGLVARTVVNVFNGTINLKPRRPGQVLAFKSQRQ